MTELNTMSDHALTETIETQIAQIDGLRKALDQKDQQLAAKDAELERLVQHIQDLVSRNDAMLDNERRLVSELERVRSALTSIARRSVVHPDDTNEDSKRDLRIIRSLANQALTPPAAEPVPSPVDKRSTGIYGKFHVRRVDGTDAPGCKHHGCRYFVLDVDHDKHAGAALFAYAEFCEQDYPLLAEDVRVWAEDNFSKLGGTAKAQPAPATEPEHSGTNSYGLDVGYFGKNLRRILRDMNCYTPGEMQRSLERLAGAVKPAPVARSCNHNWASTTHDGLGRLICRNCLAEQSQEGEQ